MRLSVRTAHPFETFWYTASAGRSGASSSNIIADARCVSYDLMRRALCVTRS